VWKGRKFEQLLLGSVISFIRIKETQNLLKKTVSKNKLGPENFKKAVVILKNIHEKDLHFQNVSRKMIKIKVARGLVG